MKDIINTLTPRQRRRIQRHRLELHLSELRGMREARNEMLNRFETPTYIIKRGYNK